MFFTLRVSINSQVNNVLKLWRKSKMANLSKPFAALHTRDWQHGCGGIMSRWEEGWPGQTNRPRIKLTDKLRITEQLDESSLAGIGQTAR